MIMLKLKQIFILKRILIYLVSLFFILFFVGGCSFRYMDWQWYKFKKLLENESGLYIFEQELHKEAMQRDMLSNGYGLIRENDEHNFSSIDSRLQEYRAFGKYFIDKNGDKHIISYARGFIYTDYGLWLHGDEGGGFHWDIERELGGFLTKNNSYINTFYLKDNEWVKIGN